MDGDESAGPRRGATGGSDAVPVLAEARALGDVSPRQRAAVGLDALKATIGSQDVYSVIVEKAADGFWLLDKHFATVYVNQALESMLGYTREEMAGRSWYDFGDPEWVERAKELERRRESGVSEPHHFLFVHKTGRRVLTRIATTPLFDDAGNFSGALGVLSDITRQKEAEEALRIKDVLNAIASSANIGMCIVNPDHTIAWYNAMFERWFGGLDKTVGRNCFEVFEGRDGICPGCPARVSFETGAVGTLERPFAPDRSRTLALTTSPIRDVDGAVLQVVKMAQDVTERHLLQEERLKTQKLEAIGTLAGGIAHDFNNLLQGVFGFISLAKTLSDPRAPVQEALQDAEKALALAVRLTGQLLTFSKGGKPVRRPMALQPVIENATRFALSGSRSDFHLAVEEGLWGAEADEGQVSQVIQNVVLNADQAMPEAGHVRIAARNREAPGSDVPGDLPPGRYVEIAVSDTGIGIPAAHLGKIFDPYFTTRQGGSGLGLATSYSIVKNHGGAIDVRSEQGRGTTFRIFLPATAAPLPEPDRAAPTAPRAARSARILVMDDEPVVLNVARKLLKALGHEVECVTNGAEALERYEGARVGGRPFDVAMLDLTIRGGMGGAETLQRLLAADPHVTAIVSSGYSDDSSIASYQAQGFKAVLNKPYTLDALREVLHRVLDA